MLAFSHISDILDNLGNFKISFEEQTAATGFLTWGGTEHPEAFMRWLDRETFEKCSILVKFKEGENFNRRNTLSILRIEI